MDGHSGSAERLLCEPFDSWLLGGRGPAAGHKPVIKIGLRVADRPAELAVARSGPAHASFREKALADAESTGGGDGVEKSLGSVFLCHGRSPAVTARCCHRRRRPIAD